MPGRSEVLALQRRVGNRAFGGLLARRSSSSSVTVELRKPPPWRKADPASPRATPENRQLAAEIDTLDALGDDVLVTRRWQVTYKLPFAIGDEEARLKRTLQALEYVLDQRARQARYEGDKAREARVGPVTPDWQQWRYVSGDAEKRAAWVRWLLEQRVRETGSFKAALAAMATTSGVEDEVDALRREAGRFGDEFERQAQINAERVISGSLRVVDDMLTSYGVPLALAHGAARAYFQTEQGVPGVHVPLAQAVKSVIGGMKRAGSAEVDAPAKVRKRMQLANAAARIRSLQIKTAEAQHAMWQSATPQQGRKIDWKEAGERKATFVAARDELATTWLAEEEAHPVLAAFRRDAQREKGDLVSAFAKLDLGELGSSDVDKEIATLLTRVLPTLAHIGRAKELIFKRLISPLTLPSVVALTQANMFIPAGSIRAGVVRDRVQAARDDRESWLVSALSLALALVTLVPTGGTSLAMVGVASATLATYSTLRELEQFELHKVLADTDLDRARALMQGDPSLARFVTSLLALGLEGLPLLHAITAARQLRVAVRSGDDTSRLVRQINDVTGEAKLGEQALADAQAAERRAARAGGEQPPKAPHEPTVRVPGPGAQPSRVPELFMGYRDRHEVADAMRKALRGQTVADTPQQIRSGMAVADLPKDWHFIERALAKATPADAAREVQELLPIVQTSLRDPDLYAEVIADAWERARRANGSIRDALVEMAKETGAPVKVIKQGKMFKAQKFYERYGGEAAYWVDNPLILADHGALTHLVQDLVVGRGLRAGGQAAHGTGIPRPARPAARQGGPGRSSRRARR